MFKKERFNCRSRSLAKIRVNELTCFIRGSLCGSSMLRVRKTSCLDFEQVFSGLDNHAKFSIKFDFFHSFAFIRMPFLVDIKYIVWIETRLFNLVCWILRKFSCSKLRLKRISKSVLQTFYTCFIGQNSFSHRRKVIS